MHLTKHHGLGNDFLVLVDLEGTEPIDGELAAAVCDRRRGVGADGLIRVTRGQHLPFRMQLRNGDGSRAEMSGNGISCLAQALVRAGHVTTGVVEVETDAGERMVEVVEAVSSRGHRMRVAMGVPTLGDELPEWTGGPVLRAVAVDVGNPHVVCHVPDPTAAPDLDDLGRRVDDATPGGANVELVRTGEPSRVVMQVYERGVGLTQACGTGAVAVAAAAHEWGLAPATVTVEQPGGPVVVELGDDGVAHLVVPVCAVAAVEWPR